MLLRAFEVLNTAVEIGNSHVSMLTLDGFYFSQQEMEVKLSEVCKAHERELADMNAANAVLKAQLEKALANVNDLHQQTVDRQAENSALRSHLEKEIEDTSGKLDGLGKKCQEQDERIKQLREELASNRKLLADNQKKDDEIIASGKAEVEALKALVSALEKQLKDIHQDGKDQMEQLEARAAVLDRELEGAAVEMKKSLSDVCKAHEMELADMNAANAVLKATGKMLKRLLEEGERCCLERVDEDITLVFEDLSAPQLENALADVKDLHQRTVERQAQNSALRFQLEKELEDALEKLDGLGKKCQEQDDRIKQLREELASNHKLLALLADNKMKDDQIIASGKAEILALKANVLEMDKKLSEACKAQGDELSKIKAANAVLKAQLGNTLADVKDLPACSFSLSSTLKR